MQQNNSQINFVRSCRRDSWFNWPTIVFDFQAEGGRTIGQFSIGNNKATFSAAERQNDFQLKKKFWGYNWVYDDDLPYAQIRYGFFSKPAIIFANDTKYTMHVKRRWNIFRRPMPDEYEHLATFYCEDSPVMVLQNQHRRGFLASEVFMPMEGTIVTELRDYRLICGMVLLFHTSLIVRSAAVASA